MLLGAWALTLVLTTAACSSSGTSIAATGATSTATPLVSASESPEGSTVDVTVQDFSVTIAQPSAPAGEITFSITNDGPTVHELVVLQTDDPAGDLPVSDGKAAEEGHGITHMGEVEDIADGATETLALELDPGNYVLMCNLPGHYEAGMFAAFTVT